MMCECKYAYVRTTSVTFLPGRTAGNCRVLVTMQVTIDYARFSKIDLLTAQQIPVLLLPIVL
jgi:hypothetical protein